MKSSLSAFGAFSLQDFMRNNEGKVSPLNIVCIGAHPGDPEFGCGGTMARLAKAGHKVYFFYLTRGEAYDAKQSFSTSGALRTKEAETSCGILNATPVFIGQTDGDTVYNKDWRERTAKMLMDIQPAIVFTQWPMDTHPDHQVAGLIGISAWTMSRKSFELFFYEVNTGSESIQFFPTDHVDITMVREQKKSALLAHQTQQPQQVYDDFFRTMEEFRGLEAGVKAAEAFIHFGIRSIPAATLK
jgi:LmbE family N-acetylglucosaminyl deacetylase